MDLRIADRPGVDVSVVVASVESERSIADCIASIAAAVRNTRSDVLVVDASHDRSADIAEQMLGGARVLRCAPGTLTPELWAEGIARSVGRVVVLTTGHFVFEPTWIDSLRSAIEEGATGACGRIELADATSITDWAVFYLRYSEFLNEPERLRRGVPGIPADNAGYDGDAIRRFVKTSDDGFWEVEFHRQLHASGGSLAVAPGATAWYSRSFPFGTIVGHRFRHGRHAGAWRVRHTGRSAVTVVLASPLVPFVLARRVWMRVRSVPRHRARFLRSLPSFLTLAAMWAVGEAVGALAGAPASRRVAPAPA